MPIPADRNHLESLHRCTRHAVSAVNQWVSGPKDTATEPISDALRVLVVSAFGNNRDEFFARPRLPSDLHLALWKLKGDLEKWRQTNDYLPPETLWAKLDAAEDLAVEFFTPTPKPLETVPELTKIGCTPLNIAEIYGWRRPDGALDVGKACEEIATPGRHCPPGWVAPVQQARLDKVAAMKASVLAAHEARQRRLEAIKEAEAKTYTDVAPESLLDLVLQNVSMRQVCAMKKLSEDEVCALCKELGIDPPGVGTRIEAGDFGEVNPSQRRILDALGRR